MKNRLLFKAFFIKSIFIFISLSALAQKTDFSFYENQLKHIAPQLLNAVTDDEKLNANKDFLEIWGIILDDPKSIKYDFKLLTTFPIFTSKNKKLRIINWYIPLSNGHNKYFGIIQYFNNQNKYKVEFLNPIEGEVKMANTLKLSSNQWLGAIYYSFTAFKRGKKQYYLLLGSNGNNERTNKKIIDVLSISKTLTFGAPIFRYKKERYHRFILEFRKDAVVSVKYNQKTKSIIFPNLSPLDKDLTGLYDYYAPDGTINSFELINGTFKYKENINNPFKTDVPKIKKINKGLFPM